MYYESEDEKKLIEAVCDVALKSAGLNGINAVNKLLGDLKPYTDCKCETEKKE